MPNRSSAVILTLAITMICGLSGCHGFFVAPTLSSISVTPSSSTIVKGTTLQFTAVGNFNDGSTKNLGTADNVAWTSSDTTAATIDQSSGVATGVATGNTTITASAKGLSGSTSLQVLGGTVSTVTVSPSSASISQSGNGTFQFSAQATFSDGSTSPVTNVATWNSSITTVAQVNNSGLASAVSQGTTQITATYQNVTSNAATLTVGP